MGQWLTLRNRPIFSDPNVAIQKGDDEYTRVNTIDKTNITTNGWDVQVQLEDQLTG